MADTHQQINHDGTIVERKTVLWPGSKTEQKAVIQAIFQQKNWQVLSVENQSGSFWKVETECLSKNWKINLYISSIRDESRQPDEYKMQLGTSYPVNEEADWLTVVLGIYTIDDGNGSPDYILSGYDWRGYDFAGNPSLRGTRTNGLQRAYLTGMCQIDSVILFRPEFIYYYLDIIDGAKNHPIPVQKHESELKEVSIYQQFTTAIRTKPFLLLAGISGTGKSRIVREFAFKSCPSYLQDKDGTTPGNYCMIEVKPNWHDSTELLGYYSRLGKGGYQFTKFVKFLIKAKMFPNVPFFVCLDEMNLAPVEQYFAEILSILETRKHPQTAPDIIKTEVFVEAKYFQELENVKLNYSENSVTLKKMLTDRQIYMELFGINPGTENDIVEETNKFDLTTEGLTLPDNVLIIGTVNMDDTTHQFSRKVIDRAMTIEMNGGRLADIFGGSKNLEYLEEEKQLEWQKAFKQNYVTADEVLVKHHSKADDIMKKLPERLDAINKVLKGTPFEVSYRVLNELTIMVGVLLDEKGDDANLDDIINQAINNILLMKILPRIEGDAEMFALSKSFKIKNEIPYEDRLEWLEALAPDIQTSQVENEHPQSAKEKIQEMRIRLENQEFTRFWP